MSVLSWAWLIVSAIEAIAVAGLLLLLVAKRLSTREAPKEGDALFLAYVFFFLVGGVIVGTILIPIRQNGLWSTITSYESLWLIFPIGFFSFVVGCQGKFYHLPYASRIIGWYRKSVFSPWEYRTNWKKEEISPRFFSTSCFVSGLTVKHEDGPFCSATITIRPLEGNCLPEEFDWEKRLIARGFYQAVQKANTSTARSDLWNYKKNEAKFCEVTVSEVMAKVPEPVPRPTEE